MKLIQAPPGVRKTCYYLQITYLFIILLIIAESAHAQQIFTVTSAADAGPGTLREAIHLANGNSNIQQVDEIRFNITSTPRIILSSTLPAITEPLVIDGTTQGGLVVLDGSSFNEPTPVVDYGIRLQADNSAIYGLEILGFAYGLQIGSNSDFIIGASGKGNVLHQYTEAGISVLASATDPAGNGFLQHNIMGLLPNGLATSAGKNGIELRFVRQLTIRNNTIANQSENGIRLFEDCTDNTIRNNRIGIAITTDEEHPNALYGIAIELASNNNSIIENRIGYVTGGIFVGGDCSNNTLRENIFLCQGGTTGPGIVLESGGNEGITIPFISSANCRTVEGTSDAGATVDLYYRDASCGTLATGGTYIGSTTASSTSWTYESNSDLSGVIVATATLDGNTSEFSSPRTVTNFPSQPAGISGEPYPVESEAYTYALIDATPSSTFTWAFSDPAIDLSNETNDSITISWAPFPLNGTLSGTETNLCNQASQPINLAIEVVPATSDIMPNSTDPVSGGEERTYAVDLHPGSTYTWSVTSPAFIVSQNANQITVRFGNSDATVTVNETYFTTNNTPISRAAFHTKSLLIPVNPVDAPVTSQINGPGFDEASPVAGGSQVTYSVQDNVGNTYSWTPPPGATIVSGQGTNEVIVALANFNGNICVTETNPANVPGNPVCRKVLVKPVTNAIEGEALPTEYETSNYGITNTPQNNARQAQAPSITTQNTNANDFYWQVEGGTIISGQGTPQVEVEWDFGLAGEELALSVTETNTDPPISGEEVFFSIQLRPNLFSIEGPAQVDAGSQGIIYAVRPRQLTTFSWSIPPGATLAGGSASNAIQVNFGNEGGEISVIGTSLGIPSLPSTISVGVKPFTSEITGPNALEANTSGIYSVVANPASTYNWTFSNNGSTLTPGASLPNQVSLKAGSYGGKLCVTETSGSGVEGAAVCKDIIVVPGAGQIQGPIEVDAYTSATYTLPSSSNPSSFDNEIGSVYRWSVPAGAIITEGRGTAEITVSFGTTTGDIKVEKGNASSDSLIVRELGVAVILPPLDPDPPVNDPGSPGNLGGNGSSLGGGNGTCTNCVYNGNGGSPTTPRNWDGDTPAPPRPPRPPASPEQPQISITPLPVDFDNAAYTNRPAYKPFIISNAGDAYLYVEGIYFLTEEFAYQFKGNTDNEFTLVSQPDNNNRGFSIAPGSRIVFELISLAPEHRPYSRPDVELIVVSNDPDDNNTVTGNYATITLTKK